MKDKNIDDIPSVCRKCPYYEVCENPSICEIVKERYKDNKYFDFTNLSKEEKIKYGIIWVLGNSFLLWFPIFLMYFFGL